MTIRELRNQGGRVLGRVAQGETVIVTRDGHPVAELRPLPGRPLPVAVLLERWRKLPPLNARRLRADIDRVLDTSL